MADFFRSLPFIRGYARASQPFQPIEHLDLCRQLILRVLLNLGGHKEVLLESHCNDREMLCFIGLGTADTEVDGLYCSESALRALRAVYKPLQRQGLRWPASGSGAANLLWLGDRLGLSPLQQQILVLCALATLCKPLSRALESLGSLDDLRLASVLGQLLDCSSQSVEEALCSAGALRRTCVLRIASQLDCSFDNKVGLMPGLAERLFQPGQGGIALFGDVFGPGPVSSVPIDGFAHLQPHLGYAISYLKECLASGQPGANVLIRGPRGAGKTALAHALALAVVDAKGTSGLKIAGGDTSCVEGGTKEPGFYVVAQSGPKGSLSSAQRLSAFITAQHVLPSPASAIIVFDDIEDLDQALSRDDEDDLPDQAQRLRRRQLEQMLQANPTPAIWVTSRIRHLDESLLRRFAVHVHLTQTTSAVRAQILKSVAAPLGATDTWCETRALDTSMSPWLIAQSIKVASAVLRQQPGAAPESVIDRLIDSTLKAVDREPRHRGSLDCAIGYDPAMVCTGVDVAALVEQLKANPSARMCFYGPPGTGKSALARHIAQALGRPALVRRSSDLIGSFVGESERAVAQAFEDARRDGAVLILDEVDSFLGSRESAVRRWEVSLVNELLQQIEDFEPGLFVATTNALDRIDEATMRRFDLKLEFRFLQAAQAGELMRRTCEKLGLYEPGCEALVTAIPRLTPGDFAAVIRQARLRPMHSGREVANRLQEEVGYKRGARQAIGFTSMSN